MKNTKSQKAIIYCRSASQKQSHTYESPALQETRCRTYAEVKNYEVVAEFHDSGVSGLDVDRPGMQEMLSHLENNKDRNFTVVVDEAHRLARGFQAFATLRDSILATGATLEIGGQIHGR